MDYSTEIIDRVRELAECLTPISDMAVLLDVDIDELRMAIRNRKTPISRAYHHAKATIALKLRKQEIDLANVGSPLAVQLTNSYLVNMDSDEDL